MKEIPLLIYGLGGVGRALLQQIVEQRSAHARYYGIRWNLLAVADSSSALARKTGFSDDEIGQIVRHKAEKKPLSALRWGEKTAGGRALLAAYGRPGTIVVDTTAAETTITVLEEAVARRYGIVLANKKPLTATWDTAAPLFAYPLLRAETTVGSGLPLVLTTQRLRYSGDHVRQIIGHFSGTLGYLTTALADHVPFSSAVYKAWKQGYTEPDPRDDLGGLDVARKALILARFSGKQFEMDDIAVESLYPAYLRDHPLMDFLAEITVLDTDYGARVNAAALRDQTLRYVARWQGDEIRVGLEEVPTDSILGRLEDTDNVAIFYTRYYTPNPLVIQGRGAGLAATAAGVLSDMMDLARLWPWKG